MTRPSAFLFVFYNRMHAFVCSALFGQSIAIVRRGGQSRHMEVISVQLESFSWWCFRVLDFISFASASGAKRTCLSDHLFNIRVDYHITLSIWSGNSYMEFSSHTTLVQLKPPFVYCSLFVCLNHRSCRLQLCRVFPSGSRTTRSAVSRPYRKGRGPRPPGLVNWPATGSSYW